MTNLRVLTDHNWSADRYLGKHCLRLTIQTSYSPMSKRLPTSFLTKHLSSRFFAFLWQCWTFLKNCWLISKFIYFKEKIAVDVDWGWSESSWRNVKNNRNRKILGKPWNFSFNLVRPNDLGTLWFYSFSYYDCYASCVYCNKRKIVSTSSENG